MNARALKPITSLVETIGWNVTEEVLKGKEYIVVNSGRGDVREKGLQGYLYIVPYIAPELTNASTHQKMQAMYKKFPTIFPKIHCYIRFENPNSIAMIADKPLYNIQEFLAHNSGLVAKSIRIVASHLQALINAKIGYDLTIDNIVITKTARGKNIKLSYAGITKFNPTTVSALEMVSTLFGVYDVVEKKNCTNDTVTKSVNTLTQSIDALMKSVNGLAKSGSNVLTKSEADTLTKSVYTLTNSVDTLTKSVDTLTKSIANIVNESCVDIV